MHVGLHSAVDRPCASHVTFAAAKRVRGRVWPGGSPRRFARQAARNHSCIPTEPAAAACKTPVAAFATAKPNMNPSEYRPFPPLINEIPLVSLRRQRITFVPALLPPARPLPPLSHARTHGGFSAHRVPNRPLAGPRAVPGPHRDDLQQSR